MNWLCGTLEFSKLSSWPINLGNDLPLSRPIYLHLSNFLQISARCLKFSDKKNVASIFTAHKKVVALKDTDSIIFRHRYCFWNLLLWQCINLEQTGVYSLGFINFESVNPVRIFFSSSSDFSFWRSLQICIMAVIFILPFEINLMQTLPFALC